MSDNNIRDDEEYKYPEDEYVVEQQPSVESEHEQGHEQVHTPEPEVVAQKRDPEWMVFVRRNKRKLGVAALAVIALIAFQIMNHEKNNKVIKQTPVPKAVQKAKPQPVQQVTTSPENQQSAVNHAMVSHELNNLAQAGQANAETMAKMQAEVQGMRSQLNEAHQNNQQLRQAMVLLLGELKRVNTHMGEQNQIAKKLGIHPRPEVKYVIRAMVDNRAWIVGNNGLSESVTVGDPVPNYGNVEKIDAVAGVIKTSSGKSIILGQNDY